MYCGDDVSSCVLDIGHYETRAGYSGEDQPRCVLPSVVGTYDQEVTVNPGFRSEEEEQKNGEDVDMNQIDTTNQDKLETKIQRKIICGQASLNFKRDNMHIEPLYAENGIMNFDYLEQILDYSLGRNLKVPIKDTPLLFTESAVHDKTFRRNLTQYMFEKQDVPAMFICKDAVLSSFACGRSTSLVLDCGYERTTATPVNDGYALQKCLMQVNAGGKTIQDQLTKWIETDQNLPINPRFKFKKVIKQTGVEGKEVIEFTEVKAPNVHPSYTTWCQQEIVRQIKEDALYVAEEPLEGIGATAQVRSHQMELPDGTPLTIGTQRVSLLEQFINNQNDSLKQPGFTGLPNMAVEVINKTDIDIRRDLFSNIILTGGNSCHKGFPERLQRQIPEIAPPNQKIKVVYSAERRFSPWMGGSILSSLGSFQQMWMSKQEFEEHGAIMIERKCP